MPQNILVTGASSGFGRLIAEKLLGQGHTVVASMRGTADKNKTAADGLQDAGAKVVEIDVTREESVNQGVADAIQAVGRLDVVVNNAGVGVLGLQESFTPEDWQKIFDVNLFVDKMGMGDALQSYNEQQEQITRGIYKGLGIESMLTLKSV